MIEPIKKKKWDSRARGFNIGDWHQKTLGIKLYTRPDHRSLARGGRPPPPNETDSRTFETFLQYLEKFLRGTRQICLAFEKKIRDTCIEKRRKENIRKLLM